MLINSRLYNKSLGISLIFYLGVAFMPEGNCLMTESQVQEAFLAAPPLIAQQIIDLTVKHPSWLRDLFEVDQWPVGNGTLMEQIVFRGMMPQIERGFDQWKKLQNNTGCDPCSGPDCSYNWTDFGGHGFERKITELMRREFRSPSYCISEIQYTAQFMEVFAKIVENLYAQVDFFKEMNIGLNFLTGLAKKYIVDSGGGKPNPENPYVYRNLGTGATATTLSALNIEMLEFFYEWMRRLPDAVPYDVVNGSPVYSLLASHQLLSRMYRDDAQLRQDVRFSGLANDLVMKYNFMSTIRGMFIAAPILYPRRFTVDALGNPVEILPFVNGIPAEIGSYTGFNPAYESAPYEEVLIHGKFPFKVFYAPTEQSLGQNTSFGPEFSWFNSWLWINPLTIQDPFRRVGYFATSATLGLSQQFSNAIFGILVSRPSVTLMAAYNPTATCPPVAPDCENEVPDVGCPCPLILSYSPNPIDGSWFLNLAAPLDPVPDPDDDIQFGIDNGAYLTGTVVEVSSDGKAVQVTFPDGTEINCDIFTTIFCDNTLGCYSDVMLYGVNCLDATHLDLTLKNPIKGDVGETLTIYYGDGTSATVTVVSIDLLNKVWVVDVGATNFCDNVSGVVAVCVPPTTDDTCPDCGGPVITQCTT